MRLHGGGSVWSNNPQGDYQGWEGRFDLCLTQGLTLLDLAKQPTPRVIIHLSAAGILTIS